MKRVFENSGKLIVLIHFDRLLAEREPVSDEVEKLDQDGHRQEEVVQGHQVGLPPVVLAVRDQSGTDEAGKHDENTPIGQIILVVGPPVQEKPTCYQRHQQCDEQDPH